MKQSPLTNFERTLITKLEDATVVLNSSYNDIQNLKQQLDDSRQEVARLTSKLNDSPILPADFKPSAATQHALSTSKAQLATAKQLLQEEINHHQSQVLHDISRRTTKALKDAEYQKALNSNYATATKAINARRNDINTNGVDVLVGYSGYTCKGEFDSQSNQLFTFENIGSYEDLEIDRQSYSIIKSDISPINAGNLYHLQPQRHSNR